MKIKIANKYYLFKFNTTDNKIKKSGKSNSIAELKEQVIGIKSKSFDKYEWILIKLSKESKFNPEDKSPLAKLIGGPIKLTIKIYTVNESHVLKPTYEKLPNKKGELDPDKRNSQFLYLTLDYLEKNKIKISDLEKVALFACQNKLEKRPLAVKLITQIHTLK